MTLVLTCLFLLVFAGAVERLLHRSHLAKIPLRIHVNGSRGKSSITRLIAAGLNAGGISTFAKTTGSAVRLIHPDGAEDIVTRNGMANISEQIRIIKCISKHHADAAVLECMALRPLLQKIESQHIVRPSISVISNIRSDHLDVMGEELADIARAMFAAAGEKSELFLTREAWQPLAEIDFAQRDHLHIIDTEKYNLQNHLHDFSYYEHEENIALALAVCEYLGVSSEIALIAMKKVTPDVGALKSLQTNINGNNVRFINAFAANDPESIQKIWQRLGLEDITKDRLLIILFNARPDRLARTRQFFQFLTSTFSADYIVIIGDSGVLPEHFLKNKKTDSLVDMTRMSAREIVEKMESLVNRDAVVFACGNIAGVGLEIIKYFEMATEEP